MDVQILNSFQNTDLYHFKVMSLKTHEDDTKSSNECKLNFHFFFELIRKNVNDQEFI